MFHALKILCTQGLNAWGSGHGPAVLYLSQELDWAVAEIDPKSEWLAAIMPAHWCLSSISGLPFCARHGTRAYSSHYRGHCWSPKQRETRTWWAPYWLLKLCVEGAHIMLLTFHWSDWGPWPSLEWRGQGNKGSTPVSKKIIQRTASVSCIELPWVSSRL